MNNRCELYRFGTRSEKHENFQPPVNYLVGGDFFILCKSGQHHYLLSIFRSIENLRFNKYLKRTWFLNLWFLLIFLYNPKWEYFKILKNKLKRFSWLNRPKLKFFGHETRWSIENLNWTRSCLIAESKRLLHFRLKFWKNSRIFWNYGPNFRESCWKMSDF